MMAIIFTKALITITAILVLFLVKLVKNHHQIALVVKVGIVILLINALLIHQMKVMEVHLIVMYLFVKNAGGHHLIRN